MQTNLVIVAHPDDEILGFGATGAKLVASGESVRAVFLCGGVAARGARPADHELLDDVRSANRVLGFEDAVFGDFPNIKMNAVPHLDIVQFIERQISEFKPDRVFTHHPEDLNDDHGHVARACLTACRLPQRQVPPGKVPSIYFMEIPSATDWSFANSTNRFAPNVFVEIDGWIDKKIEALSCYRNVMRPYPHPRSREVLDGLAVVRGGQAGLNRAEAFECVFTLSLG